MKTFKDKLTEAPKIIRRVDIKMINDMNHSPRAVVKEQTLKGVTVSMINDYAKVFFFVVYKGKPEDLETIYNNNRGSVYKSLVAGSGTIGKWYKAAIEEVAAGTDFDLIIEKSRERAGI